MSTNLTLTVSHGKKTLAACELYQTPTLTTREILASSDRLKAYEDWVMGSSDATSSKDSEEIESLRRHLMTVRSFATCLYGAEFSST